jgi:hypothetical protein
MNMTLSTPVMSGEPILVEVKGREFAPGQWTTGQYDMTVTMAGLGI